MRQDNLEYFYGQFVPVLTARNKYTHIKFGETVSLTLKEIEEINDFVIKTNYFWTTEQYDKKMHEILKEKFNRVNEVTYE